MPRSGDPTRRPRVPVSVLYMSMSLDGYIAGPNDKPGNPGGDGFGRLHEWYGDSQPSGARPSKASEEFLDEMNAAGAVLAGRRTAEQVDHWGSDVHYMFALIGVVMR
jgi:dihydrofolate reductase